MLLAIKPKPFLPHGDPNNLKEESVLRIRDPVLFYQWNRDPGFGFGIPDGKKIRIRDPG
jgi:hypothetical protein